MEELVAAGRQLSQFCQASRSRSYAGPGTLQAPMEMSHAASAIARKSTRVALNQDRPLRLLRRPHVLVLGGNKIARRIGRALEEEEITVAAYAFADLAVEGVNEATTAIIVVPPVGEESLASVCKMLVGRCPTKPVFVACDAASQKTISAIYRCGVEAVFFWPADRDPLVRTIFRIGGPRGSRSSKREPSEIALEELVTSHLKADATPFGSGLKIRVRKRFVVLYGRVDALWKLHVAERIAGDVAGVKDVVADGVVVVGETGLSDRSIANAARQVLRHTNGVDGSSLSVAVDDGVATVSGSAVSRHELMRAVELISHVRGIKQVRDVAVVEAQEPVNDRQIAKKAREAIDIRFPKARVDLAVFGGVAVISGQIDTVTDLRNLVAFVARLEGVFRVVDKVRVTSRLPPS